MMDLLNIKSYTVLAFSILLLAPDIDGQTYNTSLGLRLGDGIGISARQRLLKRVSAEGIFYRHHKSDQTVAGLMLNQHMPVLTKRLNIYAGGGGGRVFQQEYETPSSSYNAVMLNAGLEFTIARLNLSWDFVPVIPLSGEETMTTMTAFSLRYVLIKKSKKAIFGNEKKRGQTNKKHKRPQRKHNKKR